MRRLAGGLLGLGLVAAALTTPVQTPPAQAATTVVAHWELNDPAGSLVMADSSGNGIDGEISENAAAEGLTSNGSFYSWSSRCPACPPTQVGRVVRVPDDDRLDVLDAASTYTLEFRFRTTHGYGNYMQKGQSTTNGGQVKVQGPGGRVQCLFKGADGTRVGTGSPTPLDDGEWHTVSCVRTETQVKQFVDGVRVAIKNGSTGVINNKQPLTLGGKSNCDQVTITCDYFSGQLDYVKVTVEESSTNESPTASFTSSCSGTECSFDSSGSADPDGSIDSYAWTFGDGASSTRENPTHDYGTSGTRQVTLTVTDNRGATDSLTQSVQLLGSPPGVARDVTGARGDTKATVTWRAPKNSGSDAITQYVVTSLRTGATKELGASARSAVFKGLQNGLGYRFSVAAASDAGSGPASTSNVVHPSGPPSRVTQVKAKTGNKSARISWAAADPNGSRVLKYRIVTSKGQQRTVEGTLQELRFKKLKSDSSYRFRVRAINKIGPGAWSTWTKSVKVR